MAREFHDIRLNGEVKVGFSRAWAGCAPQPGTHYRRSALRRLRVVGM